HSRSLPAAALRPRRAARRRCGRLSRRGSGRRIGVDAQREDRRMTVWIASALFVIIAIALFAAREKVARGQALLAGGRMGVGCVIAEAIGFLLLAILAIVFRHDIF